MVESLGDLDKFKKNIKFNASVHMVALFICIPNFMRFIIGAVSLTTTIFNFSNIALNLYCIMLQRYNFVRINHAEERLKPHFEKKKEKIKEEIKAKDFTFGEHKYMIMESIEEKTEISLEDLISSATLDELRLYKACLEKFEIEKKFREYNFEFFENEDYEIVVPIGKQKILSLELYPGKNKNAK